MGKRKKRYLVETQYAPITVQEMEVKEVVEISRDVDNSVTLQFVFTNNARFKKEVQLFTYEYYRYTELKPGDKVRAVIRAYVIDDISI